MEATTHGAEGSELAGAAMEEAAVGGGAPDDGGAAWGCLAGHHAVPGAVHRKSRAYAHLHARHPFHRLRK